MSETKITIMAKFKVRIANEYKRLYTTTVYAETERKAFLLARLEAESKGIILPTEVWTRITLKT